MDFLIWICHFSWMGHGFTLDGVVKQDNRYW